MAVMIRAMVMPAVLPSGTGTPAACGPAAQPPTDRTQLP